MESPKKLLIGLFLGALLFAAGPAAATVEVRVDPALTEVGTGVPFDVRIVADFDDPIVGWGLDFSYDAAVISLIGMPVIGPDWTETPATPDGDGLAGGVFPMESPGTRSSSRR